MEKETPFLDFYYRCAVRNSIKSEIPVEYTHGGLCFSSICDTEIFKYYFDYIWIELHGYWGYRGRANAGHSHRVKYEFTPLRQNIILLCAAINGEL